LALDAATGMKSGQSFDSSSKTQSIKTGGHALSMLRQRKKLLKSLSEAQVFHGKENYSMLLMLYTNIDNDFFVETTGNEHF
jgi:hypothetical protein